MASNRPSIFSKITPFVGIFLFTIAGLCLCGYQLQQLLSDGRVSAAIASSSLLGRSINGIGPTSKPSAVSSIEAQQRSAVKQLMADGKYEMALAAAKSYYNVVELRKSEEAVRVLAAVLVRARGPKVAETFREEQMLESPPFPTTGATSEGESILQTIRIDSSVYDKTIKELRDKSQSTSAQLECGDLLLVADRPVEARTCFELVLQLVAKSANGKSREARHAWDGIARSIRDEDGSILRADAFAIAMRKRAMDQAMGLGSVAVVMPSSVREGAAELAPSGILNRDVNLASYRSPEDPCEKAAGDPSLVSWLFDWQRTKADTASLQDRRTELQQILGKTPLTSLSLITIGRTISFQSNDDWTEATFYAAAISHGSMELTHFPNGAAESRQIIDALSSIRTRLWKLVDGGDRTFVNVLYELNCDLVRWIPANDRDLRDARVHGFIGGAECLWAMGRIDDAVSAAEAIDTASMTEEEKQGVAWIRGLALFSKGRFSDAINQFRLVASDPNNKYAEIASRLLIVSLARSASADEANSRFEEWVRRYHPNVEQVASVLDQMQATGH